MKARPTSPILTAACGGTCTDRIARAWGSRINGAGKNFCRNSTSRRSRRANACSIIVEGEQGENSEATAEAFAAWLRRAAKKAALAPATVLKETYGQPRQASRPGAIPATYVLMCTFSQMVVAKNSRSARRVVFIEIVHSMTSSSFAAGAAGAAGAGADASILAAF